MNNKDIITIRGLVTILTLSILLLVCAIVINIPSKHTSPEKIEKSSTYEVYGIKQYEYTETTTGVFGGVINEEPKILYQFIYNKDGQDIIEENFETNYYNKIEITNKDHSYIVIDGYNKTLYITKEDWDKL